MLRIRLTLRKREEISYLYQDILHDALVNAWTCAGASSEQVTGFHARPWNFAALGWRRGQENRVHTLVVSTPDAELAGYLSKIKASDVAWARASTAESVDFSGAEISSEPDPILPGQTALGVVILSPLVVSRQDKAGSAPRWYNDLTQFDLSAAVNARLSRLAGRSVELHIQPDRLYLRAHPRHDALVQMKQFPNGHKAFVIGMRAPLVLCGRTEDILWAWYTGLGEKTRNGFGCIGIAERGIGR